MWFGTVIAAPPAVITVDATSLHGRLGIDVVAPGLRVSPTGPWPISEVAVRPRGVSYVVELGTEGRHGHQGWRDDVWGTFDGRVFDPIAGLSGAVDLDLRIRVPDGWGVATPFDATPTGWRVETIAGQSAWRILATSCIGVGPFAPHSAPGGAIDLRVAVVDTLPRPEVETLQRGTEALVDYFHGTLGWDPPHPVVVVWGPRTPAGAPIHGGSGPRGTCASHAGDRGWELLAHRLAHALDRDPPSAFTPSRGRDQWFVEGWAGYVEILATTTVGLVPEGRLRRLEARWDADLAQHPDWRVPLASEPLARGDLVEHLHYVRGPVVAARLDRALQDRTGRRLGDFVAEMARRGGTIDLRDALAAWSGAQLDDVWAREVDRPPP